MGSKEKRLWEVRQEIKQDAEIARLKEVVVELTRENVELGRKVETLTEALRKARRG